MPIPVPVCAHVQDLTFLLMEHSPNLINNRDEADHTVLWLAANAGKAAMVTLLLQYPAVSVNSCDAAGVTPLFAAARIGHLKIVQVPFAVLALHPSAGRTSLHPASCPICRFGPPCER